MKIYCFYLIRDEINPISYPGLKPDMIRKIDDVSNKYFGLMYALYAYTPEKESADYFRNTRNMDIFFEKVIEISRKEYEAFCDDNQHNLLEYHTIITKKIERGKFIKVNTIILCTLLEHDAIFVNPGDEVNNIIGEILDGPLFECFCGNLFNNDITKALEIYVSNIFGIDSHLLYIEPGYFDLDNHVDQLGLYIKIFGNTLK